MKHNGEEVIGASKSKPAWIGWCSATSHRATLEQNSQVESFPMNRFRCLAGLGAIALVLAFVLGNPTQTADALNPNPVTVALVAIGTDSLAVGIDDANAMVNTAITALYAEVVNVESNIGEAGEELANYPNPFNYVALSTNPSSTWNNDGLGTNTMALSDVAMATFLGNDDNGMHAVGTITS